MDDLEPIVSFRATGADLPPRGPAAHPVVAFDRKELNLILSLYGRYVASGEWRDYALDFTRDKAVFSIFRHTGESPIYRVVKDPALARKQGQYSVMAQGGLIMRRGQDLAQVIRVLLKRPRLIGA
ncbi:MAG: DUF2794 domain-containing protein [Rhizobiales bacterium]|nr:DUF2794 domain-containing protein [Hyphomicrobiales bacterium]